MYFDGIQLVKEDMNIYSYDNAGNLTWITHKNGLNITDYYVVCNSRGDTEAIYNSSGTLIARYTYDSWGRRYL